MLNINVPQYFSKSQWVVILITYGDSQMGKKKAGHNALTYIEIFEVNIRYKGNMGYSALCTLHIEVLNIGISPILQRSKFRCFTN